MRGPLSFLVKVTISGLLLYFAFRRVDLTSVGQRLGGLDLRWIIFVLFLQCMQMPLAALRWREIITICGTKLSLQTALRFTLIGQFFNQVLPSTVGGDAARIWLLARGGAGWSSAIYSVLIDRVVGVSILALLVVVCLPWTLSLVHDPIARAALMLIGFGALAAALIFLALGLDYLRVLERWWLTRHLAVTSRLAWRLCRSVAGMRVAVFSFAVHLMTVLVAWGAAMAAHVSVDFLYLLVLVLPVILVATVPISIAGWGVRESAMILAFSYVGLPESDGLIVSILYGVASLSVGAVGGIVWIASGYRWRSIKSIEGKSLAHDPLDLINVN